MRDNMKAARVSLLAWAASLLLGTACTPGIEAVLATEALRDRACACTDNACGKTSMQDLDALSQRLGAAPLSTANASRVKQAASETAACAARLGVGAPTEPTASASSSATR